MAHCLHCKGEGAKNWCGGCYIAVYCSSACQKSHWRFHKKACEEIALSALEGRSVVTEHTAEKTVARLLTVHEGAKARPQTPKAEKTQWETYIVTSLRILCQARDVPEKIHQRHVRLALRAMRQISAWPPLRWTSLMEVVEWMAQITERGSPVLEVLEQIVFPNVTDPSMRVVGLCNAIECLWKRFGAAHDDTIADSVARYASEMLDLVHRGAGIDYRFSTIGIVFLHRFRLYHLEGQFLETLLHNRVADEKAEWFAIYLSEAYMWQRRYKHAERVLRETMRDAGQVSAAAMTRLALITWEKGQTQATLDLVSRALEALPASLRFEIGACTILRDLVHGVRHANVGAWINKSLLNLIDLKPSQSTEFREDLSEAFVAYLVSQSALDHAMHAEGDDGSRLVWLRIAAGVAGNIAVMERVDACDSHNLVSISRSTEMVQKVMSGGSQVQHIVVPEISAVCCWSYRFYATRQEAARQLEELLRADGSEESLHEADKLRADTQKMGEEMETLVRALRCRVRKGRRKKAGRVVEHHSLPTEESHSPPTEDMAALDMNDDRDKECCICYLELEEGSVVTLGCTHCFHQWCILDWIGVCRIKSIVPACPMCRSGDIMM